MTGFHHLSVLLNEAVAGLAPHPGGVYVDATLGGGGHAAALLAVSAPHGRVVALDRDPAAVANAQPLVEAAGGRLEVILSPFGRLGEVLAERGLERVAGVLFDLGVSSHQLDTAERGFSFQREGPLDMRMGVGAGASAAELVNSLGERELADLFFRYGEERHSRRLARAVVEARRREPITTTARLAQLIATAMPGGRGPIHPATRVFQALRIAVNDELGELERGVAAALEVLEPGGRVAVITFHSLEDRIVKTLFREAASPTVPPGPAGWLQPRAPEPRFRLVTRKPLVPGEGETAGNPRARSAKLRIVERLPTGEEGG